MRDDMRDADRLAAVHDVVRYLRPGEKPSFETLRGASARLREGGTSSPARRSARSKVTLDSLNSRIVCT